MRHAVIMAGGSGTRLWPLSRKQKPKQLLRLFEGKSLLRRSFERLYGLLPAEQIYVITGRDYIPAIAAELPELPKRNLMAEPCARDTANAVGLAAHLLALRDPEGTMGVFTADHIITPIDVFQETVRQGFEAAEQYSNALITFGVKPATPHTGYGYVHRGDPIGDNVYAIRQFKEKPDAATARQYFDSGDYYWNSGMFVWRLPTIIGQIDKHQPEAGRALREIARDFADSAKGQEVFERFSQLTKISVDFAIMEKADQVGCVEMPCQWLDVGSWTSLEDIFEPDESGNTHAAENVLTLDARNNIFVSESDHLIAAIGIENLVVIHSDDATVICRKDDAQRIKELVEQVKGRCGDRHM